MNQFALLYLAFNVYGEANPSFLTVPSIYTIEECNKSRSEYVARLQNPKQGDKVVSNIISHCQKIDRDEALKIVKNIEQSKKNNFAHASYYQTIAFKTDSSSTIFAFPDLQLYGHSVCNQLGQSNIARMHGTRFGESEAITNVWYNCVALSPSEADQILAFGKQLR